jgi:hypothetical protein
MMYVVVTFCVVAWLVSGLVVVELIRHAFNAMAGRPPSTWEPFK